MDADFVYKFALPFSFVRGAKDVPASATKTDVDEEGVTTTKRESRKASRRNYAEMMHPEEEEEEENKKKRRKKQKVMVNKELSPVVEVPSKREMRHRRKKEQEEIEEETAVEIRDGDLADEETQRLAISLGFTKAIRYGSCRHALLEAMRDKPNGVSVEEIMKTSEKNGLARSWKKSTIPKNTIVSMMGDKTFTRIARGVYVLTCYLNDRENNRDENTKSLSQARLKKRQQEYNETLTKRNANVVEDVHEVASTRLPTALVDEKQLKNNVENERRRSCRNKSQSRLRPREGGAHARQTLR